MEVFTLKLPMLVEEVTLKPTNCLLMLALLSSRLGEHNLLQMRSQETY